MSGTYQHREGGGSMLANQKTADNQPDFRGDFMLGGKLYEIAAWSGTTANGKARMSLKIQEPRERNDAPQYPAPARPVAPPSRGGPALDDDIPFSACKE